METEKSAMATAAEQLATAASTILSVAGEHFDANSALDYACKHATDNATEARTRGGQWAYESTSEQIEEALFFGSVASDILDGETTRPSVGNVREYALKHMAA